MSNEMIWLIRWFQENAGISKEDLLKNGEKNYFELGWLDSLRFINFIAEVEEQFRFHFTSEQFQQKDFTTLNGLAKTIIMNTQQ